MFAHTASHESRVLSAVLLLCALSMIPGTKELSAQAQPDPAAASSSSQAQTPTAGLPLNFQRHTGDLDEMVKRGSIRALCSIAAQAFSTSMAARRASITRPSPTSSAS